MTDGRPENGPQQPAGGGEAARKKKNAYLGSVRFFKHLILTVLALMILVPTTFAVGFGLELSTLRAQCGEQTGEAGSEPLGDGADALPLDQEEPPALPAVETPEWQSLYPDLYARSADRSKIDREKTVYLTFDDGPSARTPEILEILDRYGVKATFFVVGKEDEQSRQWMRDITAAGHTLGIHSYSHNYSEIYASVEDFLEDFNRIYCLIEETTGTAPQIFRFPGGSINGYNGATYREIIGEMVRRGFVYFDWNVSSGDAAKGGASPAVLAGNALDRVDVLRRAVVLMHDSASRNTTVEALPAIIEGYQRAGFTFEALTPEVKPVIYSYPK